MSATGLAGQRRPWAALPFALLACAMNLLDATVVMVALPAIERELGANAAMLQWTSAGYTLAFAVLLITGGRLGDRFGRKRVFLIGTTGFIVVSTLCGMADSALLLVVFRVLQGALAALMIPQVLSFVQVDFSSAQRPRALAMYGMTLALGGISGPLLGGVLIQADLLGLGWRVIFLINVPIGLVALAGVTALMRESRVDRPPRLDPLGVLLVITALIAVMYPLVQGGQSGWPLYSQLCFPVAAGVLVLFWVCQRRQVRAGGTPLVDPRVFRYPGVFAGLLIGLVFYSGTGYAFVLSLYLQGKLGFTPMHTGLALLPFSLGVVVGSGLSTPLAPKLGRAVVSVASLANVVGMLWLIYPIQVAGAELGVLTVAPGGVLTGLGMGMIGATLFNIVLARVPWQDAGTASGLINTTVQVGTAVSVALLGTVYFTVRTAAGTMAAAAASLWVAAALFAASFLLSFTLPAGRPGDRDEPAAAHGGESGRSRGTRGARSSRSPALPEQPHA